MAVDDIHAAEAVADIPAIIAKITFSYSVAEGAPETFVAVINHKALVEHFTLRNTGNIDARGEVVGAVGIERFFHIHGIKNHVAVRNFAHIMRKIRIVRVAIPERNVGNGKVELVPLFGKCLGKIVRPTKLGSIPTITFPRGTGINFVGFIGAVNGDDRLAGGIARTFVQIERVDEGHAVAHAFNARHGRCRQGVNLPRNFG